MTPESDRVVLWTWARLLERTVLVWERSSQTANDKIHEGGEGND